MDNSAKQSILQHFNNTAPDTLDMGDFGPWSFQDVKLQAGKYVLAFKNAAGSDSVKFSFSGEPVQDGTVAPGFLTAAQAAIEKWEAEERGDDDEDDEDFEDDEDED